MRKHILQQFRICRLPVVDDLCCCCRVFTVRQTLLFVVAVCRIGSGGEYQPVIHDSTMRTVCGDGRRALRNLADNFTPGMLPGKRLQP
jgi:hypothetical protein